MCNEIAKASTKRVVAITAEQSLTVHDVLTCIVACSNGLEDF